MARRLMSSLRRMAKRIFSSTRRASPAKQRLHGRRMQCEHLEQRELLAITGSPNDDFITLQRVITYTPNQAPQLSVNWVRYTKPIGSLSNWAPIPGTTAIAASGTDILGDPNTPSTFSPLFLAGGGGANDTFMFDLTTQTIRTYSVTEPAPSGGTRTTTITTYDFQTYDNAVAQMLGRQTSKYNSPEPKQSLQIYTTAGNARQAIDAFSPVYFDNDSLQITFDFTRGSMLPPDAPTRVSATDTNLGGVIVTWDAMPRTTSYDVYRSTDASPNFATKIATVTAATYTDTATTLGQVYYYWVKAKNIIGNTSGFSDYDTGGRGVTQVVSLAPTGVYATTDAASAQVRIFWQGVGCATSYEVIRNTINDPKLVAAGGTAVSLGTTAALFFDDTTAVNGTTYYYWVRALNVNATAPGPVSTSVVTGRAAVPGTPGTPANVKATYDEFANEVRVTWDYVANGLQYNVYRNTSNALIGAVTLATGLNSARYDDFAATTGVKYWYFVVATNPAGPGPASTGAMGRRSAFNVLTDRNSLVQFVGTKDPGLTAAQTPANLYYAPNVSLGVLATQIDLLAPIVLHPLGTTAASPDFPYGGGTLSLTTRPETPFIDRTLSPAVINWDPAAGMIRDLYTATGNFSRTFFNMQDPYVQTINGQAAILSAEGSAGTTAAPIKTKVAKLEALAQAGSINVSSMGSLTLADVDGLADPDSLDTTTYFHPAKTAVSTRTGDISITTFPIPQPNPDTTPPKAKVASVFQVMDKVHAGNGGNITLANATNSSGQDNFFTHSLIYADGGNGNISISAGNDLLVEFSNTLAPTIDTSVAPNVWRALPEITTVGTGAITLTAVGAVKLTDDAVVQSADGDINITAGNNLSVFEMSPTTVIRSATINPNTGAFLSFQQGRIHITCDGDATVSTLQNASGAADAMSVISTGGGIINGLVAGSTAVNINAMPSGLGGAQGGVTLGSALGIGSDVALRTTAGSLYAVNSDASRARNIRIIETDDVDIAGLGNFLTDPTRVDNDPTTGLIDLTAAGNIHILGSGTGVRATDGNISIDGVLGAALVPNVQVDQPVATTGTGQVLIQAGDSVNFGIGSEVQQLTITATGPGGHFHLIYGGNLISGAIAWNASIAAMLPFIQAQLDSMFGAGNTLAVAGGGFVAITFQGALANTNLQQLTVDATALVPAGSASVATVTNGGGNTVQTVAMSGIGSLTFSYQAPDGTVTAATAPLTWAALGTLTAAAVQTNLETIPALTGNVKVIGANGGPFTVTFTGQLRGTSVAALTATNNSGTAAATVTVDTAGGYISSGSGGISVIANTGAGAGGLGQTITMSGDVKLDGGSGPILLQTSATSGGVVTGGNLSVGQLTTTNNGAAAITLRSGGSVLAGALPAGASYHTEARTGGLAVVAQSGVGDSQPLCTRVSSLDVYNQGAAPNGEQNRINLLQTGAVAVVQLSNGLPADGSAATGSIALKTLPDGVAPASINIRSPGLGGLGVSAVDGDVSLTAAGAQADVIVQAPVLTTAAGRVMVVADDSVRIDVGGSLYANGASTGSEVQTLTISPDASGGSFRLIYGGNLSSGAIPWSADATQLLADIQAALDSMFGANNTVATDNAGSISLAFQGGLANANLQQLSVDATNLVNGTAAIDTLVDGGGNSVQTVSVAGSGALTFSYTNRFGVAAQAPAPLSWTLAQPPTAAQLRDHLQSIPGLAGDVSVIGAAGGPFTVLFNGDLTGSPVAVLTAANGGGNAAATIAIVATGAPSVGVRANAANTAGDSDNGIAMTAIGTETLQIAFDRTIVSGSFTLTYAAKDAPANGATLTTAVINWSANATTLQNNMQSALTTLFGVGNVQVITDPASTTTQSFTVTFTGALVNADLEPLTIDAQNNKLVGGGVQLSTLQEGAGNGSQVIDFRNAAITDTTTQYRVLLQYNGAVSQTPLVFSDPATITPAQVFAALQGIPSLNGNVAIVGPTGGPFTIVFRNALGRKNILRLTALASVNGVSQTVIPFTILRYHEGIPALASETPPAVNGGSGIVVFDALRDAAGDVRITNVQTQNLSANAVTILATGAVIDGSRTSSAVAAPAGGLYVRAVNGVGSAWPFKTQVGRLDVVNANLFAQHNIQISEADGVVISRLLNSVSDDANAGTGSIVVTAGLPADAAPMTVLIDPAGAGVHTSDGNITIRAQGVNANITVAAEIASDDRGGVTIAADDSVWIPASGAIRLGGTGAVSISASSRAAAGDLGGTLTIDGGAVIDAGYGTIVLSTSATQGADVTLSGLQTAFTGADETQLLTFIAGSASGITNGSPMTLLYGNLAGPAVAYSNTPATMVGNLSASLESMFGKGNVRVTLVSAVEAAGSGLNKPLLAAIYSVVFTGELGSANLDQLSVQPALPGGTVTISTQQNGSGNAIQKLTASTSGGAGTIRLSFNGQAAASALTYSSVSVPTPADVEANLNTIPALNGNVAVIGANGGPYTILFRNALAHTNVSALTATTTGAAAASITVASEANTTAAVTINSSGAVRKAIASVNEVQLLTLDQAVTGGAFKLNYGPGFTTAPISWNSDPKVIALDLQAKLENLFGIGNVAATVDSTSAAGTVFAISFSNVFESVNLPQPTVIESTLAGGGATVSTRQNGTNELQTLTLSGPDNSAFEVGYLGQWGTTPLSFRAGVSPTAAALQADLETLPEFLGNVRVLGNPGGPFLIIFENGFAHTNMMPLTVRSTAGVAGLVDVQAVSDVNALGGMLVINSKLGVGDLAPLGTTVSALSVLNGGSSLASDVMIRQIGPVGLLNLQNNSPADGDPTTGVIDVQIDGTINVVPNGTGVGNTDGNITLRAAGPNSDIIVQNQIVAGQRGQIYFAAEDSLVFLSGSSARATTPDGIVLEANASDVAGNDGNTINMAAGAIVDAGSGVLTVSDVGRNSGPIVLGSLTSSNRIDIRADKSVASAANMPSTAVNAITPTLSITAIAGIGAANLPLVIDARAVTAVASAGGVYLSDRGAMTVGTSPSGPGIQAGAGNINVTATGPLTVKSSVTGSNDITLTANETTLHSVFGYGAPSLGWIPLMGDWNGDGVITAGLFDPVNSIFYLRNSNDTGYADITFGYGAPNAGWTPLVGDWNGDGRDTVGFYDPATSLFYLRNTNDTGMADYAFGFGAAGAHWEPLAGDWNGDGKTTVGLFDRSTSWFYLTDNLATGFANYTCGYGVPGSKWKPVIGNWDGQGGDTIGFYDPDSALFMLRNTLLTGAADQNLVFGPAGADWTPFAGDYSGQGFATVGLYDPSTSLFHLTPGDDVTVYDGTTVATTNGNIVLAGGDGVNVNVGAVVRATGGITVSMGYNDNDGFGMSNINGALVAPLPVLITGGPGNDTLIVNLSYAATPPGGFNFAGGDGYDSVIVSGTLDNDTFLVDDNTGDLRWQGNKVFGFYTQTEELRFYTLGGDDLVNFKTRTDLATRLYVDGGADSGNLSQPRDAVKLVGTAGADNIAVGNWNSNDQYWLNHVETLQVFGGAGNDTLTNNTSTPAVLNGGAGNDTLTGGHAQGPLNPSDPFSVKLGDALFGGDGVDSLTGRDGESYLFGDHDFLVRDVNNRPVAPNPVPNDTLMASLASKDTLVALDILDHVNSAANTGDLVVGPSGIALPPAADFRVSTTANINAALDGALTRPWAKTLAGPSS